jgi:hypothetical protein
MENTEEEKIEAPIEESAPTTEEVAAPEAEIAEEAIEEVI